MDSREGERERSIGKSGDGHALTGGVVGLRAVR
jgi:hypothetical protein